MKRLAPYWVSRAPRTACIAVAVRMSSSTNAHHDSLSSRLASMSTDDLMSKALSYSKQFIPVDQRGGVRALLLEVLHSRVGILHMKGFRDVLALANLSEHHALCVEIFRKRYQTHSTDTKFTVYDVVVESAYKMKDLAALEEIADICSRKLRAAPREVIADFAMSRTLWRVICLHCDPDVGVPIQRAAREAVDRIWERCFLPAVPGLDVRVTLKFVIQEARRQLLYASPDEKGEMAFFLMCKQKGILKNSNRPLHELRSNETYYCALIRTCRNGCFSDVAMDYFEELRSASTSTMLKKVASTMPVETSSVTDSAEYEEGEAASETVSDEERALFESLGFDLGSSQRRTGSEGVGEIATTALCSERSGLTEVVIFTVVSVLHAAKDNQRIVDMGKSLLSDGTNALSASILATLGSAGGEVKDFAFVQACYDGIVKSQRGAQKPNQFLVYSALSSISKCSVRDFREQYLDVCVSEGLISNDPETHTYLIIQNAMGSVNPMSVVAPMIDSAINDTSFARSLSIRVASLLFKVLLRSESPEFLDLYKRIVQDCGLFKQVWVEELILWADRRRYFLSQGDRKFIVSEIKMHYRISDLKSANLHGLEKLRTHVACIHHDAQYNSLERFNNEGWISPEPTVLDSRVHFILKRKTCVEGNSQEHLRRFVENHPGIRSQHLKTAHAAYMSALSSPHAVTQDEFRYGLLDLLSRKQIESL